MKLIKTVVLEKEEVVAFLEKYLPKYVESKTHTKVASVEVDDDDVTVYLEDEDLTDE